MAFRIEDLHVGDKVLAKEDELTRLWGAIVKKNRTTVVCDYDGEEYAVRVDTLVERECSHGAQSGKPKFDYAALINDPGLKVMIGTVVLPDQELQDEYDTPHNRLWVIIGVDMPGGLNSKTFMLVPINDDDDTRMAYHVPLDRFRTVKVAPTIPMEALK